MKYVSIDIETTGLDPDCDLVLELAAVVDDLMDPTVPVDELPALGVVVRHERIHGDPRALAMNARLLEIIAHEGGTSEDEVMPLLAKFLGLNGVAKVWAAGKNFGAFDLQFLARMPGHELVKFGHRHLDPALSFVRDDDVEPPSLSTCLERAGLPSVVSHRAVDDARDVVRLVRHVRGSR